MKNGLVGRKKGALEAVRHVERQSIFVTEHYKLPADMYYQWIVTVGERKTHEAKGRWDARGW